MPVVQGIRLNRQSSSVRYLRGCIGLLLSITALAALGVASPASAVIGFIENRGQWDDAARYFTRGAGGSAYLTAEGIYVGFMDETAGYVTCIRFEGAQLPSSVEGRDELVTRYNFFIGNDPERWRSRVPAFAEVVYHDLWPGVDLAFVQDANGIRYRVEGTSGVALRQVRFSYEGAQRIVVEADGSRRIVTPAGVLTELRPAAGENEGAFLFSAPGNPIVAGEGERDNPAALIWSTFLGGSGGDYPSAVVIDPTQRVIVGGYTTSANFPMSAGAYDVSYNGSTDALIAKLNPTGSILVWCSFFGGVGGDRVLDLVLDSNSDPILAGYTASGDFPTSPGAYDRTHNGGDDGFVAGFDSSGAFLNWSTYIGGSDAERVNAIALDNQNRPALAGWTQSPNFPNPSGGYGPGGGHDIFVCKLSNVGDDLLWSRVVGGSDWEEADEIALDPLNNPVATGFTWSPDFPVTAGAYDESHNGLKDVFVVKFATANGVMLWNTFIGGSIWDQGEGVACDNGSNVVVAGTTHCPEFPTTPGAFDETHNGSGSDIFVTKLNPSGSAIVWSTFVGGTDNDHGYYGILHLNPNGSPVVDGYTYSTDFPTTPDGYKTTNSGSADIFVVVLESDASAMTWGTLLGGTVTDEGYGIAIDDEGDGVVVGSTGSSDFPTTEGALDRTINGGRDFSITKLDLPSLFSDAPEDPVPGSGAQRLYAGAPNIVHGSAALRFVLAEPSAVTLTIHDVAGRMVRELLSAAPQSAGAHDVLWDGRNDAGQPLGSGVYLCRFAAGGMSETQRVVVVR